jgi:hypothetical protein
MASHWGNSDNLCSTPDDEVILLWGISFLAKLTAKGLVNIGIVATVTHDDMVAHSHPCDRNIRTSCTADAAVEPIGMLS